MKLLIGYIIKYVSNRGLQNTEIRRELQKRTHFCFFLKQIQVVEVVKYLNVLSHKCFISTSGTCKDSFWKQAENKGLFSCGEKLLNCNTLVYKFLNSEVITKKILVFADHTSVPKYCSVVYYSGTVKILLKALILLKCQWSVWFNEQFFFERERTIDEENFKLW